MESAGVGKIKILLNYHIVFINNDFASLFSVGSNVCSVRHKPSIILEIVEILGYFIVKRVPSIKYINNKLF